MIANGADSGGSCVDRYTREQKSARDLGIQVDEKVTIRAVDYHLRSGDLRTAPTAPDAPQFQEPLPGHWDAVDFNTLDFVAAKSAELVSPDDSPLVRARKLFLWMRTHIRYTSEETQANDMTDVLRVVLRDGKANCAPQSLLYAALLRTNPVPIPARIVCGQWVAKGRASTHHWVEFYLEGIGWIPADLTFGGDPIAGFGQTTVSHLPSRAIAQLPVCIEHLWQLRSYTVTAEK